MRYVSYYLKKIWPPVVIIIMILIFLKYISGNDRLAIYTPKDHSEYTVMPETETEHILDMETFQSAKLNNLFLYVPKDWSHVVKSGFDTFVDRTTASSIQLQIIDYDPLINNTTQDSLLSELSAEGFTLISYTPHTPTSYSVVYQGNSIDGVIDYFEYVTWDRLHIIKFVSIINDMNYNLLSATIDASADSLQWVMEQPVPEGITLYYDQISDFEFGYPCTWETGITDDGIFYASDMTQNTGSYMTVTLDDCETMASDISQYDYSSMLSSGKTDFMMNVFRQEPDSIYSESSYVSSDGILTGEVQYYYTDGYKNYAMTFDIPAEVYDLVYPFAISSIDCFRSFREIRDDQKDSSHISATPGIQDETETECISESPSQELLTEKESELNVDSFSQALCQIVPITASQAQQISDLWDGLDAGNPIYAQGVSEDPSTWTISIQSDSGLTFFLILSKSDHLPELITVGSVDGSILYQRNA